jgi:hypothetical protein
MTHADTFAATDPQSEHGDDRDPTNHPPKANGLAHRPFDPTPFERVAGLLFLHPVDAVTLAELPKALTQLHQVIAESLESVPLSESSVIRL